jgi:hypothetical protein
MTKAKTPAPEAETQTEGQDTVAASTEGQDTVAASTEGQDTVAAITAAFANPPDGAPVTASEIAARQEEWATRHAAEAAAAEAERRAAGDDAAGETGPVHEPAALNVYALTYCARQIDMLNTTGHRLGLIDELVQLYAMQIDEDEETGTVTIACEGVTIDPADTVENALTNWANAARRASLDAAA